MVEVIEIYCGEENDEGIRAKTLEQDCSPTIECFYVYMNNG